MYETKASLMYETKAGLMHASKVGMMCAWSVQSVKLASLEGGIVAQMAAAGDRTASLPAEGMRCAGAVAIGGIRDGVLWLIDARGQPFMIPLSHAGLRARLAAAQGDAAAARATAERAGSLFISGQLLEVDQSSRGRAVCQAWENLGDLDSCSRNVWDGLVKIAFCSLPDCRTCVIRYQQCTALVLHRLLHITRSKITLHYRVAKAEP